MSIAVTYLRLCYYIDIMVLYLNLGKNNGREIRVSNSDIEHYLRECNGNKYRMHITLLNHRLGLMEERQPIGETTLGTLFPMHVIPTSIVDIYRAARELRLYFANPAFSK